MTLKANRLWITNKWLPSRSFIEISEVVLEKTCSLIEQKRTDKSIIIPPLPVYHWTVINGLLVLLLLLRLFFNCFLNQPQSELLHYFVFNLCVDFLGLHDISYYLGVDVVAFRIGRYYWQYPISDYLSWRCSSCFYSFGFKKFYFYHPSAATGAKKKRKHDL